MKNKVNTNADCIVPILKVSNIEKTIDYFTEKLCFKKEWDWGNPVTFASVTIDKIGFFLCLECQGKNGTWSSIFINNLDEYYNQVKLLGAKILMEPKDEPWDCREFIVELPDEHKIRFTECK